MPTDPAVVTPTAAPTNKSVAATGGSAFGAAVATIILYFLRDYELPEDVKTAIITIITAVVTAAAAYFTPPGTNEAVLVTSEGGMKMARVTPQ